MPIAEQFAYILLHPSSEPSLGMLQRHLRRKIIHCCQGKVPHSIQLFMGTPVNTSALDYHIHAVQHITKAGIRYQSLQNEIYCLILRQMFGQDNIGLRGWLLLFLLTSTFAPTGNILWYVTTVLDHFASQPSPTMADLTQQCQSTLKKTQKNGPRECKPSKLEVTAYLMVNIIKHCNRGIWLCQKVSVSIQSILATSFL